MPVLKLNSLVLGKKKLPTISPLLSVCRGDFPPRAAGYSVALAYSLPNSVGLSENLDSDVSCRTQSAIGKPPKNANTLVLGRRPLAENLILRDRMNGITSTSATCSPMKSCMLRVVSLKDTSLGIVVNKLLPLPDLKPLSRIVGLFHRSASKFSKRRTVVCMIGGRVRVSTHSSEDGDNSR